MYLIGNAVNQVVNILDLAKAGNIIFLFIYFIFNILYNISK